MNKKLEEYSREELIEEIKSLKKRKKFGLVWEDKKEDIVEKCKNEIPVLKEVPELAINEKPGEPTNLIIEGDNFASLQVLNYTHHGKIDVIYIDPPYNTGNKDFIYNDSYVDSEDSFRHSKWLSFMDRRLRLAKELLSDDGVIFISIDDNEQAYLKIICDSIFGEKNQICNYIWQKNFAPKNDNKYISVSHEYILMYAKKRELFDRKLLPRNEKNDANYSNPDNDKRGRWASGTCLATTFSSSGVFEVIAKNGKKHMPPSGRCWRYSKQKFDDLIADNRIWFGKDGNGVPRVKRFLSEMPDGIVPQTLLKYEDVGSGQDGAKNLRDTFGGRTVFSFPKPIKLMQYLIDRHKNNNSIVLDFFAGTGTTGQAVLELNKKDGGNRKFILCTNNESNIARDVTYPRIKTVATGIRPDGSKYSDGISANIRYFTTDFIEKGVTNDATRAKLFEKSDEMIQVRENVFELVDKNDNYTFYKNNEKFVAIIKDPFNFGPIWYELEEKNTEKLPVKLYVFSYSNYTFEDEIPDTDLKYEICAIPNSIMEVYRKISDKKEER